MKVFVLALVAFVAGIAAQVNFQTMLTLHNNYRAQVTPPSNPPLNPFTWNAAMASPLVSFMENCSRSFYYGPFGQLMYMHTSDDWVTTYPGDSVLQVGNSGFLPFSKLTLFI